MANPYIGFRCPRNVYDILEEYLKETEQERSEYLIGLICKDQGIEKNSRLTDRVESLECRVSEIEARLDAD